MTTETYEPVAVPHFETRLWRELARAHDQMRRDGPPPPQHHPRPGRRGRRFLLLGVGSIAAAAALVLGLVVADSDDDGGVRTDDKASATTSTTTPTTTEPADLATRIATASEQAGSDFVLHVTQDDTDGIGDSESWTDLRTGARRTLQLDVNGAPSFDTGPPTAPTIDQEPPPSLPEDAVPTDPSIPMTADRQVDHCFGEYADTETWALPATDDGQMIAENLREGSLIEDGTEMVDGRELIRLVEILGSIDSNDGATALPGDPNRRDPSEPARDVSSTGNPDEILGINYVDPDTYRPVRRIGYPGSSAEYVMTYEYLPRTPENLAQIAVPVPEGFTQVAALRGDGERVDAGCG